MDKEKFLNLLGIANKAGKLVTGEEGVVDSIRGSKVHLVILGSDAGPNTSKKVRNKSKSYNVKLVDAFTIKEINAAIGKENRVVVGVKDKNFKDALIKLLD